MLQRFEQGSQEERRDACETFCLTQEDCWGCSVDCTNPSQLDSCGWNAIPECGTRMSWDGSLPGDVTEKSKNDDAVKITLSGPADKWFAVGFNASLMVDQ